MSAGISPSSPGRRGPRGYVRHKIAEAEEIHKWCTTTVYSRDGHPKIMRYDLKTLVRYSALFTIFSEGTVFTMDPTASVNVLVTCVVFVFSGLCALIFSSIGGGGTLADLDTEPLSDLSTAINALVPFVLALYLSLTLRRWWDLRVSGLGGIFDALTNVCMIIACELHEDKWELVRNQVAKFGLASVELLMQAARSRADVLRLVDEGLLTECEADVLGRQDELWERPMICWAWILRISLSAMDFNHSPHSRSARVMSQCVKAREGMAVMNTYLDTQLPFGYVHLITLLVNVQNVTLGVKCGTVFAQAVAAGEVFLMAEQVLTLVVVVFLYQGMLQISYVIADPFGDDILDFPIVGFMKYVSTTVEAMFEAQAECPIVAQDGSLHRPQQKPGRREAQEDRSPQSPLFETATPGPLVIGLAGKDSI